jgi:hypothetical protein
MNPLLELQLRGALWMGIKNFLRYPEIRVANFKILAVILLNDQYIGQFPVKVDHHH